MQQQAAEANEYGLLRLVMSLTKVDMPITEVAMACKQEAVVDS